MHHSRLICTLVPPSVTSKSLLVAPPVVFAKRRTQVDGAYLLLSSLEPSTGGATWMRPARQVMHYALAETPRGTSFSLDVARALRRFVEPLKDVNVARLGAKSFARRGSRLPEMLAACVATPMGIRGLFEADVVAERNLIVKLMLPYKAAFNASFVNGVLFMEEYHGPEGPKLHIDASNREYGFLRACTEIYTPGWAEPAGRTRHTFHAIVARSLGGLNLLLSGPVDCVSPTYTHNPHCYMQLVMRPLRDDQHMIRSKTWKQWLLRAHLFGTRALFLGLVDEAGVLRSTQRFATDALPGDVQTLTAEEGGKKETWDPADAARWGARVLNALRDFLQEAADGVALTRLSGRARARAIGRADAVGAVWRVEVSPMGSEIRVLVRQVGAEEGGRETEAGGCGIVPAAVVRAYRRGRGPES